MSSKQNIGLQIKIIRKQLGLSMTEFGKLIDEKAKSGTVSNWETGKNLPNNRRLKRISELGGVDLGEMIIEPKVTIPGFVNDSLPVTISKSEYIRLKAIERRYNETKKLAMN
ncbi:helix-turn-helix transcriptional regulator [Enterococcus raffinosus]|uniref:helix-turn-helix domain-containing protein n=1 Tax=Enterococcus raffinosus TaxID=71452 RepID=UPI002890CBCF|nr:helix-turn-helix transcriptional regulator [Enterococcus raffinosus]MDT2528576.1 helix-turn-helix transcriptional regulator [Enterococcus raffinosus]